MNDIPKIKVIDIDESEAEYSSPLKVGDEINVAAGKLTGTNYAGGTAMRINGTDATATVCKAWWDYECGWRYRAEWDGNGARTDAERCDVHVGDTVGFSEFDIAWPESPTVDAEYSNWNYQMGGNCQAGFIGFTDTPETLIITDDYIGLFPTREAADIGDPSLETAHILGCGETFFPDLIVRIVGADYPDWWSQGGKSLWVAVTCRE